MKKIIIGIMLFFLFIEYISAQCVPDAQYQKPGFYSTESSVADTAKVGDSYSKNITVVAFVDTTLNEMLVKFDSVVFLGIENLPDFINYDCHNSNCFIYTGGKGCIYFSGTPKQGDEGIYPVNINMMVYGKLFGNPTTYPMTHSFKLYVTNQEGQIKDSIINDVRQLNQSTVDFDLSFDGDLGQYSVKLNNVNSSAAVLSCYSYSGRLMYHKKLCLDSGVEVLPTRQWPKGVYLVRFQVEGKEKARKIMVF